MKQPLVSITPVFVMAARIDGVPRQYTIWRPGGAVRKCCIENPIARAAWWADVEVRWDLLEEKHYERSPFEEEELEDTFVEEIIASRRKWFAELAHTVPRPTSAERKLYAKFMRNGWSVYLDEPSPIIDLSILGIDWPFTRDQLKLAWRQGALRTHPDHGGNQEDFMRLKIAYEEGLRRLDATAGEGGHDADRPGP